MMLATYDVPWWGWPITAALVGVCGAILVAWIAFVFNRHLKLLDATRTIGEKLWTFKQGIFILSDEKWSLSARIEGVDGWDKMMGRLYELKAAVEILEIYGDDRVSKAGEEFYTSAVTLTDRVRAAIWSGDLETRANDKSYLADNAKMSALNDRWSQLLSLVRKNLRNKMMNAND